MDWKKASFLAFITACFFSLTKMIHSKQNGSIKTWIRRLEWLPVPTHKWRKI